MGKSLGTSSTSSANAGVPNRYTQSQRGQDGLGVTSKQDNLAIRVVQNVNFKRDDELDLELNDLNINRDVSINHTSYRVTS